MVEKNRHQPLRVLIIISNKNAHWEQSWSAPEGTLLPLAYQVLQEYHLIQDPPPPPSNNINNNRNHQQQQHLPKMTLLAKQRWQTRIFLVLDISNPAYDPATGHLPEQNNLPVAIVRLGQAETVHAYAANRPAQNKVTRDVARAHTTITGSVASRPSLRIIQPGHPCILIRATRRCFCEPPVSQVCRVSPAVAG